VNPEINGVQERNFLRILEIH